MDTDAKKQLLRTVPYGLYAACTRSQDGEHHIFLLSWLTQASFEPPLVACCVHTDSTGHRHLTEAPGRPIVINLLGDDQQPLGGEILKKPDFGEDEVAGTPYEEASNGCAMLPETLGALEATVEEHVEAGDHSLFLCRITEAHAFNEGAPLTHTKTGWSYAG